MASGTTQRATDSEVFFRVPTDFEAFLQLLEVTVRWTRWTLHEYCLMANLVTRGGQAWPFRT